MVLFGGSFWVSVSTLLGFNFIYRMFFRVELEEAKSDVNELVGNEDPHPDEEEEPNRFTEFKFMRYDELFRSNVGNGDSDTAQTSPNNGVVMEGPEATSSTLSKEQVSMGLEEQVEEAGDVHEGAEFLSEKDLPGSDSDSDSIASGNDFSCLGHFIDSNSDAFTSDEELHRFEEQVEEDGDVHEGVEFPLEKDLLDSDLGSDSIASGNDFAGFGHFIDLNSDAFTSDEELHRFEEQVEEAGDAHEGVQVPLEKDLLGSDSGSDSIASGNDFSGFGHFIDSNSDAFTSDEELHRFEEQVEEAGDVHEGVQFPLEKDLLGSDSSSDSIASGNDFSGFGHFIDSNSDAFASDEELHRFEEQVEETGDVHEGVEFPSEKDLLGSDSDSDSIASGNDFSDFGHFIDLDSDVFTSDEELHRFEEYVDDTLDSGNVQELIEQLKKVKATRLPTIPEESEYPKTMEDLKPLKIHHEDTIGELHKFHKSYREKIMKLDILSYQKMHVIGFLQSKEPLQSISFTKSKQWKSGKAKSDPIVMFLRDLHSDLEAVYVGQVCLSWEFLQWQYGKTLELLEADPRRMMRYNEVAGEFQQFQVLIQRFIENDPFEGPRVLNYVRNRLVLLKLLQVPIIRDDAFMSKRNTRSGDDGGAITSDMLVEIMEESIRMFWKFIRIDRDTKKVMQIGLDPSDKKLLFELKEELDKKERKVIMRSGKSMMRRLLRHEEEESSELDLHFLLQVEMKVVARVLRMSRITTEQLLWCRDKLSKISFVDRRISVEPSFLLFPC